MLLLYLKQINLFYYLKMKLVLMTLYALPHLLTVFIQVLK